MNLLITLLAAGICWRKHMDRGPAALSAASGGLAGLVIQPLLKGLGARDGPVLGLVPPEPHFPSDLPANWYAPSICLRILIGLSLGPVCELLRGLRASWSVWLRRRLAVLLRLPPPPPPRPLFDELSSGGWTSASLTSSVLTWESSGLLSGICRNPSSR